MKPEEERFAEALASAIAADLRDHPVDGRLDRIVLRWSEAEDPSSFTVHALGTEEQEQLDEVDAWYPLEWGTVDRELERTDRVAADAGVAGALEPLTALYEDHAEVGVPDPDDGSGPSVALTEAARALPAMLDSATVSTSETFCVALSHFEGWGMLASLEVLASDEVREALDDAGLLPEE